MLLVLIVNIQQIEEDLNKNKRRKVMKIKLDNGSTIKSIDSIPNIRSSKKSFEQMKWIMGDVYKGLHWYQKIYLRFTYSKMR